MDSPSSPPAGESKAQEQARLRRERRNAKIQAGGSERLNKITSLSGGTPTAEAGSTSSTLPSRQLNKSTTQDNDPEEVDITNMFARGPPPPSSNSNESDFARLLRAQAAASPNGQPGAMNFPAGMSGGPPPEDPMMAMMAQLLGSAGLSGDPGAAGGGLPPGLAEMLGGGQAQQQAGPPGASLTIWRIVHAVFAFFLAIYALSTSSFSFSGSKLARSQVEAADFSGSSPAPRLFLLFSTVELVLQTTRFYLDGGQPALTGVLGFATRMLPEPWAGYARLIARYGTIYTAIVADALMVVFVMGVVAWWNGGSSSYIDT